MFGWFSSKTELESFCKKINLESAADQFDGNEDENGLRKSTALLLIYAAYEFWKSIKETTELKEYVKHTSANVVIFETLVYVWSHIATEIDAFLEDEYLESECFEDDPVSTAIGDSLHISISLLNEHWSVLSAQDLLKSRLYLPNPVKAMEKFSGLLLSSYNRKIPVPNGTNTSEQEIDLLTKLPLLIVTSSFSKVFLPGITESVRRMAQVVINRANK